MKNRLQALGMLDRALSAISDSELEGIVAALPDDHRSGLDELCGAREGGFKDPAARTLAIRSTAARGRVNGDLERVATVLTDVCLAKCIEELGDDADNPSEEQLLAVTPGLIDSFGLPLVRLMLATSLAGEAAASVTLMRLLKHNEQFTLPPAEPVATTLLPARTADDDVKAKRKAAKEKKQAEARARREQQLRARGR